MMLPSNPWTTTLVSSTAWTTQFLQSGNYTLVQAIELLFSSLGSNVWKFIYEKELNMNRICLHLRILLYLWTSLVVWLRNVVPLGEAGFSLAIEEESVPSGFINSFLLYVVGCKHTWWLQSFSSWKRYSVHKYHSLLKRSLQKRALIPFKFDAVSCEENPLVSGGILQRDFLNCKGSHFILIGLLILLFFDYNPWL